MITLFFIYQGVLPFARKFGTVRGLESICHPNKCTSTWGLSCPENENNWRQFHSLGDLRSIKIRSKKFESKTDGFSVFCTFWKKTREDLVAVGEI